jgi:MFS transporter, DHA3 family, macrolide efflux protein
MQNKQAKPTGMTAFITIWLGQIVSVLASSMSHFALSIWMYQETQSATAMGLMQVFFITPFLIMSPFAGVMVDRYNRKLMMMISDFTAFLATAGVLILIATGRLEFWHLYIAAALNGIGNTFQWPAYSAAISTMIPKNQLGRANGLMSLMEAGPGVLAPLMAGALLPVVGLTGLLTLDVVTFFFAIGALLIVHIPQPRQTEEGKRAQGSILKEAAFGFRYIFARPSLLGLQLIFFFANLFQGISMVVFAPMVLARTDQNTTIFGSVQTAAAAGMVAGGIFMSAWGGFKRRTMVCFSAGFMWVRNDGIGLKFGLPAWLVAGLIGAPIVGALVNASNQAIWQSKVAPDLQGRVFSARRLIAWFTTPISPIIGGVLADFVLEPAMQTGDCTAQPVWLAGGNRVQVPGWDLLMVFCGIAIALIGLAGYFIPVVRNAEDLLPDHDQSPEQASVTPAESTS